MKLRYLLFACEHYYPNGGWQDFIGAYEMLADAQKARWTGDEAHIVDLQHMQIVQRWNHVEGRWVSVDIHDVYRDGKPRR
jgi:hypothetical protein